MTSGRGLLAPAFLVLAGLLAASCAGSVSARTEAVSVVVDLGAARQMMQGFGTSVRVWSDPHVAKAPGVRVPVVEQRKILRALYRTAGLTRVRPVLDMGIQPSRGAPFNFSGRFVDDHVAYVKQARQFGLRTVFPGPVYLEDWMRPNDPAAYVDWAMAMLEHWRSRGYELALYAPLNEPEIARDFPAGWMHDVVLQLGRRLRAAGLETKLVIPDDENPKDAYERARAVLDDPAARRYVAAVAYHVYRGNVGDMIRIRQLAARYGLPLWMTEYSSESYVSWKSALDWAEKMHTVITQGDVGAVDYLWGFFGDWVETDTMVSIDFDGGSYRGFSLTPIYWMTGQFSRFVRPGFRRVSATPDGGAVLASAYRGSGKAVVVVVNTNDRRETTRIRFAGGRLRGPVTVVRSSERERWRRLPAIRPSTAGFTTTLPPLSVTTFVAKV